MWEKIKSLAGDIILFITLALSGVIWVLLGKNRQIKDQLAKQQMGEAISKTLDKNAAAAVEVDNATKKFDTDLDSYHNSLDELSSNHRDN